MSSVQAYVSRRAFDAFDMPLIVKLAKLAGINRPRIESSTFRIPSNQPAGSVRVTCSLEMALGRSSKRFARKRRAEEKQDGDLVIATAQAVRALLEAIDRT